jgi:hypothetical protein
MRRAPALLTLGFALMAAPAASQTTVPIPAWLGLTFETPAAGLREILGDPVRVTLLADDPAAGQMTNSGASERKARYVASVQPRLYAIVTERNGYVVGIEGYSPAALTAEVPAMTDPSGVAIGATEEAVLKAHPDARRMSSTLGPVLVAQISSRYVVSYALDGGRINAIDWFTRASTDPPRTGPPLAEPAGDSAATAVLVVAKNETEGIDRETIWMRFHPCDGTNAWSKRLVATSHSGGRTYDAISYVCPTNRATRTVFFDITPFFGKL